MKHTNYRKFFIGGAAILILLILIAVWGVPKLFSENQQEDIAIRNFTETEAAPSPVEEDHTAEPKNEAPRADPINNYQIAPNLSINSSNAVLIRCEDSSVLFEKNSAEKIYPASMTKIMTAIVALENLNDLNEYIVLEERIFSGLFDSNASVAGFSAGEEVRAIDLLYGLMLPSGAECGIGLAHHIAGSEIAFVDLMNRKANELGMVDTHFINTSGLHDANHYSTVKDIAVLLQYAFENDTFYKIFTSGSNSTSPTNKHVNGLVFNSTLFSNITNAGFEGGAILGGKTGSTSEAGQCLASLAEVYGEWFILVTAGATARITTTTTTAGARGDNRTNEAPGGDRMSGAPLDIPPSEATGQGARGNYNSQSLHIDDAFTIYTAITI